MSALTSYMLMVMKLKRSLHERTPNTTITHFLLMEVLNSNLSVA